MACPKGTPIYPSMDGVVTATGYNSTYGNYVIIQHHSGYKTLYGHMSKILCKKGNFVYTSTKIGLVGSTGMSTGPHLHFTVYKNGKSVNPLPLLNKRQFCFKVHFSCPVKVSLENEYNLKFTLSSYSEEPPLQLVCKPMWVKKENTETQIGFKYLFSPDDSRLHEIINHLEEMEDDSPEII